MGKENSKIEKQREELRDTLRETAKLHLIKNGYDENLIESNFSVNDTKGNEVYKTDIAVLDKNGAKLRKKQPSRKYTPPLYD